VLLALVAKREIETEYVRAEVPSQFFKALSPMSSLRMDKCDTVREMKYEETEIELMNSLHRKSENEERKSGKVMIIESGCSLRVKLTSKTDFLDKLNDQEIGLEELKKLLLKFGLAVIIDLSLNH
jgi:hypothetical protein